MIIDIFNKDNLAKSIKAENNSCYDEEVYSLTLKGADSVEFRNYVLVISKEDEIQVSYINDTKLAFGVRVEIYLDGECAGVWDVRNANTETLSQAKEMVEFLRENVK